MYMYIRHCIITYVPYRGAMRCFEIRMWSPKLRSLLMSSFHSFLIGDDGLPAVLTSIVADVILPH